MITCGTGTCSLLWNCSSVYLSSRDPERDDPTATVTSIRAMQADAQKGRVALRFTLDDIDLLTTNVPQIVRIRNIAAVCDETGLTDEIIDSLALPFTRLRMRTNTTESQK